MTARLDTLRSLLERVEAVTEPDRTLDGQIMFVAFAKPVGKNGFIWPEDDPSWAFAFRFTSSSKRARKGQETIEWQEPSGSWILMNSLRVPKLTASLDAAVALVEGAFPEFHWRVANRRGSAPAYAWLFPDAIRAEAVTPALSLPPSFASSSPGRPAMTEPRHGACSTCRFWDEHKDAFDGFCRRLPPAVYFQVCANGDVHPWGHWPDTGPDEWCGEHQPADDDEEGS